MICVGQKSGTGSVEGLTTRRLARLGSRRPLSIGLRDETAHVTGGGLLRMRMWWGEEMATNPSIFDKIVQLGASVSTFGHRLPRWQPSVEECVDWLETEGLTRAARSYQPDRSRDPAGLLGEGSPVAFGIPSHRAERRRKADLDAMKRHFKEQSQ